MRRWLPLPLVTALLLGCDLLPRGPVIADPARAGPDARAQGEYANPFVGVQVVARGRGDFEIVRYEGGLPALGWDGAPPRRAPGTRTPQGIVFEPPVAGLLSEGVLALGEHRLSRVDRVAPSVGAAPPPGARALHAEGRLDGIEGRLDAHGHLSVPAVTRDVHRDFRLHLEFRLPFMPESRGQGRANSGVYLQERYEIQILDSFGDPPDEAGCAALYRVAAPLVPMAMPPLEWQVYDVEFRAARFDAEGRKIAPARVSVRHNDVLVHDDVPLAGPTGRGAPEDDTARPIAFQDHGSPVVFRNVWVLPLDPADPAAKAR